MKYTVEDIKKILEERKSFKFMKINDNGEKEGPFEADMIFFQNWLINGFETKEFCVALLEYDIYSITPISKIIKII